MDNFSNAETKSLLAIWADASIQRKLEESYRNRAVYEEIAQRLRAEGYDRSWLQCQRKIKNLKTAYRKAKDHNSKSGRNRAMCSFYDELDAILADRPSFCPHEGDILDSGDPEEEDPEEEDVYVNVTSVDEDATSSTAAGKDGGMIKFSMSEKSIYYHL